MGITDVLWKWVESKNKNMNNHEPSPQDDSEGHSEGQVTSDKSSQTEKADAASGVSEDSKEDLKVEVEELEQEPNAELTALHQTDPPSAEQSSLTAGKGDRLGTGRASDITETVYKKVARWTLLISVVLLPLFFLPWTTSIIELNKQTLLVAVAGIGLVLWLLDLVMSGNLSWRFNPLDKGVVAIAGAPSLIWLNYNPK